MYVYSGLCQFKGSLFIREFIYQDDFLCVQFFGNMNPHAMFTDVNILMMLLISLLFSQEKA